MKFIFILFLIFAPWSASFAASQQSPNQSTPRPVPVETSSSTSSETEIKLLKMQIALMKESENALLSTVYWTLGTVATVTALLVGFGWLSNFKFHDSEKQRLKDELNSKINEITSQVESKVNLDRLDTNRHIESRLESHNSMIEKWISNNRTDLTKELEKIAENIPRIDLKISNTEESIAAITLKEYWIETNLRITEEMIWELKEVPINVLITQYQGLESAIACDADFYVKSILEKMTSTIDEKIIPGNFSLGNDMINSIKNVVQNSVKKFPIEAAQVLDSLSKIKIKQTN